MMKQEAFSSAIPGEQGQASGVANAPRRRSRLESIMFTLPALLFQLCWGWYPLLFAFLISFTDAQPIRASKFTGLASYLRVLSDPLTAQSFRVSLIYSLLSISLTFLIPIIVAILLMEMPRRLMRWMMLLWFLPISAIASSVLWRYMYNAQYGLLQAFVTKVLHLPSLGFLNDPNQVIFWLVFPGLLLFGPGLVYMSALQSVPQSYYEAAEVEGSSFVRKIWTISLPRLRPMIAVMLTFALISTPQEFTWPQLMTNGDPGGASRTVVMYMYSLINDLRFSDATALSILLFLAIMAVVILFRRFYREDPDR